MSLRQEASRTEKAPGEDDREIICRRTPCTGVPAIPCRIGMQSGSLILPIEIDGRGTFPVTMVSTGYKPHIENLPELLRGERKERLECYSKVGTYLEGDIKDGCRPVHVCLGDLPRLGVGQILVAETGHVHGFLQGLAELVVFKIAFYRFPHCRQLGKGLGINRLGLLVGRYHASEIFVCEDHGTVYEIAEDRHKFVVVAGLEIFPAVIIILGLRSIGAEHISQHIFLSRELLKIFLEPYCPVPGSGNLSAFKIEELVCRYIVRKDEIPIGLQH